MPTQISTAVFHILLALGEADRHGLGIADWVERKTDGAVELPPGTLYRSLKDLAAREMIEEVDAPKGDADSRRRFYSITPLGRRVVAEEAARLARIVDVARRQNLLPGEA